MFRTECTPCRRNAQLAYIWYGGWGSAAGPANAGAPGAPSTQRVLTDFAQSIGGSAWYRIAAGYYQVVGGAKRYVSKAVSYSGSTVVRKSSPCWQVSCFPTSPSSRAV